MLSCVTFSVQGTTRLDVVPTNRFLAEDARIAGRIARAKGGRCEKWHRDRESLIVFDMFLEHDNADYRAQFAAASAPL